MTGQVDAFREALRARLMSWGRTFALHRDGELLGHQSVNMLQVLIDHKGEMPAKPTGYKPMEINLEDLSIEMIVTDIARVNVPLACCLRAYYCGSGRKNAERHEQACALMQKSGHPPVRQGAYIDMVKQAEGLVGTKLVESYR